MERPDLTPRQEYSKQVIDEGIGKEMEYLQQIAERDDLADIALETQRLVGVIAPTILSTAQSSHADLIVMSSHGYTGFKRWSLGSVAQKVVRHSPVSVLVLREGATLPTQAQGSSTMLSVLVPLDGSELAEAAIQPAAQLLNASKMILRPERVAEDHPDPCLGQKNLLGRSRRLFSRRQCQVERHSCVYKMKRPMQLEMIS